MTRRRLVLPPPDHPAVRMTSTAAVAALAVVGTALTVWAVVDRLT